MIGIGSVNHYEKLLGYGNQQLAKYEQSHKDILERDRSVGTIDRTTMGSRSSRRTLDPYDMPVPHHRQNFNPQSKNHHLNSANFLRAQE